MNNFILQPNNDLNGIRQGNLDHFKRVEIKITADKAMKKKLALKSCPIYKKKISVKSAKAKATREANKLQKEINQNIQQLENDKILDERKDNAIMFKVNY